MKQLMLFPGGTPTTALGYGTTSLMGLPTNRERQALLATAFEAGIRHFDTAPYYGYGEAERAFGDFLMGKREQVTLTTKFGIAAPALVQGRFMNLLARRILGLLPSVRAIFSKQAQALSKKGGFQPAAARRSLDQSLTALKTDYIDLFLLHEPTYADAACEPLHQFLETERQRGRIRAYGCGGEFNAIRGIAAARLPTAGWLQFEDNVLSRRMEEIRGAGARCITYRTFHQALGTLDRWLVAQPGRYAAWERQLQLDLRAEGNLASLLLALSLARNPNGIVLFSTRRADHIRAAVRVVTENQITPEILETFAALARSVAAPAEVGA